MKQTATAQPMGQYKETVINMMKREADFVINQMNPIHVTFRGGESRIVTRAELAKMQKTLTWITNF